jgi:putative ABC transport system ATP-binding protein
MDEMSASPVVRLRQVEKIYKTGDIAVAALKGVSLSIPPQRFSMIIGPSGSGKTTLLNLIGCIDMPTRGTVEIAGQDAGKLSDNQLADFRARQIGFIFQHFSLMPVLSAFENVEYPLLMIGEKAARRREMTMAMLEAVGLADQRRQRPNQLSGGQQQRVAIARALVKQPKIVLADEPTANLDTRTGTTIIDLMQQMQASSHTTFIFSTHDPQLMSRADETFVIRDGELVDHVVGGAARPAAAPAEAAQRGELR